MRQYPVFIMTCWVCLLTGINAQAKIDLVTLPARDRTQLTVYNSADLTLVREQRTLTLKKGINRLEFGWENTLIDPTSVQLTAPKHSDKVRLLEVRYPPGIKGSAIWTIESAIEGPVAVEITFFTSGINWHALYNGTLSRDEKTLQLDAYVTVNNRSGEDYERATTRVIVGSIHMLDEIAALAGRKDPYNRPGQGLPEPMTRAEQELRVKAYRELSNAADMAGAESIVAQKAIIKEGLSEYFLYTIEGTEDIRNGWGKRLPSFSVSGIPVKNLYRYEEERFGKTTHRIITFKNDEEHKLGEEPLPNGKMKFFRRLNGEKHLSYIGQVQSKYIPVDQKVELDFGASREVKIGALLMTEKTDNYLFDRKGNISGYDRRQEWEIKLENNRDLPVSIEVWRNFNDPYWEINNAENNGGEFDKVDIDSVKYTLELPPRTQTSLFYT
ncbi:MAG TPA: hypothetical protein VLN56_01085, partial [Gammaproteobacteria bacterium]|nr:hypothetical protein [Gammaproteobacteria bacterium]